MYKFDITKMVPQFLLNDKNGYALAKALEASTQMMNDIIAQGVKCVTDYDTMPEWRLDELAWETNCLYDYSASIEEKREWIKNAAPWYQSYGTPEAIEKIVKIIFGDGKVEEWFEYGGEPYHFKIRTQGTLTKENSIRLPRMIARAKNVRSVLQLIEMQRKIDILEYGAIACILTPHITIQSEKLNDIYLREFVGIGHVAVPNIILT